MSLKIGAYIRVSTEEQAQVIEGSLDSQKFRISGYVDIRNHHESAWGKIVEMYVDDGYSAKDTRRPQYQKMMKDIRTGKINLILVTDISRLSRNISDFCDLLKDLEKYKAKFLSMKEQFDSSTPAGEMMLFNMINLAQFERKQTSERVATGFHARALRGLKNGGAQILGYDPEPSNPGRLVINEEEAVWVQKAFEIYLDKGSTRETVNELNRLQVPRKNTGRKDNRFETRHVWTYSAIKNLLRNRAYIGEREINCENKNVDPSSLKPWQRYHVAKASWPAIVDQVTFTSVQRLLDAAKSLHRGKMDSAERRVFLLSGVLRCGECGIALIGQSAHGKKRVHRYYSHKDSGSGEPVKCSVKRYNAEEVEQTLLSHLAKDTKDAGYLENVGTTLLNNNQVTNVGLKKAMGRVEESIRQTDKEIEAVFKFQLKGALTADASHLVAGKLNALSIQKKHLQENLSELLEKAETLPSTKEALAGIDDRLSCLRKAISRTNPSLIKRLIRNLYDIVILNQGRIEAFYITADADPTYSPSSNKALRKSPGALPILFANPALERTIAGTTAEASPGYPFNDPSLGRNFAYWVEWWT